MNIDIMNCFIRILFRLVVDYNMMIIVIILSLEIILVVWVCGDVIKKFIRRVMIRINIVLKIHFMLGSDIIIIYLMVNDDMVVIIISIFFVDVMFGFYLCLRAEFFLEIRVLKVNWIFLSF